MKLRQTIDEFIESVSIKSLKIYEGKINAFYRFLTTNIGINDNSFESYLSSMRIDEIINSLKDYIIQNQINKVSVAYHYIVVVKRYFNYLYSIGIENTELLLSFSLDETHVESFNYHLKKFIDSNTQLTKTNPKSELSYEEIELLLIECNEEIYNLLRDKQKILNYNRYPTSYNDFMYAVLMKIMAYTGIKYNVFNTIRLDDFDEKHGRLTINGFNIHLPDNMTDQLREFKEIRSQLKNDSELLFAKINGQNIKITSEARARLEEYIGRTDMMGITKFGVIQMIKKGINQSLIQEFTGVGTKVFDYCQSKVNGDKKQYASRYMDSKLRSMQINDLL